jgi:murein DD-endopeptidase MepM/ murein hydrolase activator NlpD
MDKKFKFSDQPLTAKITYSVVIAILTITAIVVGLISASNANKDKTPNDNNPPIVDETPGTDTENGGENKEDEKEPEAQEPAPIVYYAPVSGSIMKGHSVETPVFSQTLGDFRVHTGIDIAAEIGAEVKSIAGGTVSAVRNDPFMGKTVEVTHEGGIVSVYSNLSNDGVTVKVGDTVAAGDKLGVVGDTSLTELADESHLHFEILVSGVSVNPLDYISRESQKNDLGVK